MQILETVGRKAIQRVRDQGGSLPPAIWVTPELVDEDVSAWGDPWAVMSRCGQCGNTVPSGEVAEGLKNALPPNARGETEVLVLCPQCLVQTPFVFTPFGARAKPGEAPAPSGP
jgi:hypothetical protein